MLSHKAKAAFPFDGFRAHQEEMYEKVISQLDSGKYDIFQVEAPTGAGKSPFAYAFCKYFKTGYILTPYNALQDQYKSVKEYKNVEALKGRNKYNCIHRKGASKSNRGCDKCCAKKLGNPACSNCPYVIARDVAYSADVTVSNYNYFISASFGGSEKHVRRPVLVLDEGHVLEDILVSTRSINVGKEKLTRINKRIQWPNLNMPEMKMLEYLLDTFQTMILPAIISQEPKEKTFDSRKKYLDTHGRWEDKLKKQQKRVDSIAYLLTHAERFNGTSVAIKATKYDLDIKPLSAADLFKKSIDAMGARIVLMSATPKSKEELCKRLKVDPNRIAPTVKMPSNIPINRRPVYLVENSPAMNYRSTDADKDKQDRMIQLILDRHIGERGVIHTVNKELAKRVSNNGSSRLIDFEDRTPWDNTKSNTRKSFYEFDNHSKSENNAMFSDLEFVSQFHLDDVLVTASMEQGFSLENELAQFQIIIKCPFLNMKDPWVDFWLNKALSGGGWGWYSGVALSRLTQMGGRACRSPEDFGATYIIDQKAIDLLDDAPDFFSDAFQTLNLGV